MHSLRFQIAVLALLLFSIPIALLGIVLSTRSQGYLEAQSLELQAAVGDRVRVEVESYIDQRLSELRTLERVSIFSRLGERERRARFERMLVDEHYFQELGLFDADGKGQWVSRTDAATATSPRVDPMAVEHAFSQRRAFIGIPRFDPQLREPLIDISLPVVNRRSGEIQWALAAVVRLKPVWDLIAALDLPEGADAYVIDEAGRILVHRSPSTVLSGIGLDRALNAEYATPPLRISRPLTLDNGTASVVVTRAAHVALGPAIRIRELMLIMLAITIGFSALLGILLARRISRPVEHLARAATDIADGRFDIALDAGGPTEIRELGRALRSMAVRLSKQIKRLEDAEFSARELAHVTIESIGDGVITTDQTGRVTYLNPVAEHLTGWSNAEAEGQPVETIFKIVNEITRKTAPNPVARALAEGKIQGLANHTVLIRRDGHEYAIQDSVAPILGVSGEMLGAVMVFSDVSEARALEREITHQATHDWLTNLINRQEFEHRLRRVLESTRGGDSRHALCYLDLDQFKIVNDTCGHTAGDELLRQVSALFLAKVRSRDTLGRIGGDEFVVLMEHCEVEQARRVAEQLRKVLEEFRFTWEGRVFSIGVSIGVVGIDRFSESYVAVLKAADNACYLAKESGRNRVNVYRDDDQALTQRRDEMDRVTSLKRALEENRFELDAQAISTLGEGSGREPEHFELLLRLVDIDGKRVLPSGFMRAAERYDLMVDIDRWVVERTLAWLAQQTEYPASTVWSINLSGQTLGDEEFLDFVLHRFDENGVDGEQVCFEVTETAAISNLAHATRFIHAVRRRGCKIALDDFGSGLSSFGYLKTLAVDYLKIDGVFVKDVADDDVDLAMVRSINEIGHLLGMRTVAECVESPAILEHMRALGVDAVQGMEVGLPSTLITAPPTRG